MEELGLLGRFEEVCELIVPEFSPVFLCSDLFRYLFFLFNNFLCLLLFILKVEHTQISLCFLLKETIKLLINELII